MQDSVANALPWNPHRWCWPRHPPLAGLAHHGQQRLAQPEVKQLGAQGSAKKIKNKVYNKSRANA